MILFDSSGINRSIGYKDIRLKKFHTNQTMNIVLMMTTTSEQCN